jgi:hypothetical protein
MSAASSSITVLDQPIGNNLRFLQTPGIDIVQADLDVAQRLLLQHVTHDIAHEHGAARTDDGDFDSHLALLLYRCCCLPGTTVKRPTGSV